MDNRANINRSQRRKLPKRVCLGRLCSVCCDMATGMHYGIYTCNGCEAFFRRTVINNRQFRCSRGGACVVSCQERCVCRACRYEKCLIMGMDRDSVHCNRDQTAASSSASSEKGPTPTMIPSPRSPNVLDISRLLNLENLLPQLRLYDIPMQRSLIDSLTRPSLLDAPNIEFMSSRYKCCGTIWNDEYLFLMPDVMIRILLQGLRPPRCAESCEPLNLDGSLGRLAAWVRKDCVLFIEYAKCFPVFFQLSLDDKIHIIQNNTLMQQTLTQAFHSRDFGPDTIIHPDGCSVSGQSLPNRQRACSSNNHEINELWIREDDASKVTSIATKMIDRLVLPMREHSVDITEVALLRVLLFLDPEQDYITPEARDALEEERRKYFSSLLRYVIEKHDANGPQRFGYILLLSNALQEIATDKKRALVTFDIFATSTEKNVASSDSLLDSNILDRHTTTSCTSHRRRQYVSLGNISEFH